MNVNCQLKSIEMFCRPGAHGSSCWSDLIPPHHFPAARHRSPRGLQEGEDVFQRYKES